ncbi:hypothetical protein [Stappia sp. ICDLI1TA098]
MPRALSLSSRPSTRGERGSEESAAAMLGLAVALGLLFALSLTMFGGPLAHTLKRIAPAEQAATETPPQSR